MCLVEWWWWQKWCFSTQAYSAVLLCLSTVATKYLKARKNNALFTFVM
jgi:hypothetical protein